MYRRLWRVARELKLISFIRHQLRGTIFSLRRFSIWTSESSLVVLGKIHVSSTRVFFEVFNYIAQLLRRHHGIADLSLALEILYCALMWQVE